MLVGSAQLVASQATQFELSADESKMVWLGKKATGKHMGEISLKKGVVTVENGKYTGGELVIDMTSIVCTDIEDESGRKKLEKHLKDEDFFDVANFPEAKFVIKSVTKDEKAEEKNMYVAIGALTMKGITNDLTFPIEIVNDGSRMAGKGVLTFDRTKWDIKYASSFGNAMINDDVELTFGIIGMVSSD